MKIAIIGFCNLNIMQYLYKYTNVLDRECIEYDVIYWNRLGIDEKSALKGMQFNIVNVLIHINHSIRRYYISLGIRVFLHKKLKQNKYDKLIILTTRIWQSRYLMFFVIAIERDLFDYRDITKREKIIYLQKYGKENNQ